MSVAHRREGCDGIARPPAGKQPACSFLSELGEEAGAQELDLVVPRQLIGFDLRDDQRIRRFPRLGSVAGEEELRRERVTCEKGVDAVRVSLEAPLRPRRESGKAALGLSIEAKRPNELVDTQQIAAPDFGHPSLTDPAQDLHLEHPLARMQIAERARRVVHRAGEDVRDAIGVAPNPNFSGKTGELFSARIGRHGAIEQVSARERRESGERERQTRRPI